jgi:hypothetical protein
VIVVGAAVVVYVVGRTGALGVSVEGRAGQYGDPQARSVGQQPPPDEAGHDLKPEVQVSTLLLGVLEVGVTIIEVLVVLVETNGTLVDTGGGTGTIVLVEVTVVGGADGSVGVMTVVIVKVVVEALKADEGVGATKTVVVPV